MTCTVEFATRATLDVATEHMKALAPLLVGRALPFAEPPTLERVEDGNGRDGTGVWVFREGDVVLTASCRNDGGDPREGWGYALCVTLATVDGDGEERALCRVIGGGWEPVLTPLRFELSEPSPDALDAVRSLLTTRMAGGRDDSDALAALSPTIEDFARRGLDAAIGRRLASWRAPLAPTSGGWQVDALFAQKARTVGLDDEDRAGWLEAVPSSAVAWAAAADATGGPHARRDAPLYAALLDPFRPGALARLRAARADDAECLAAALRRLWRDPHFRPLHGEDVTALEGPFHSARPAALEGATRVAWVPPTAESAASSPLYTLAPGSALALALGFAPPLVVARDTATRFGPAPLAPAGVLWGPTLPVGVGWSGRASYLERPALDGGSAIDAARAFATLVTNCENRVSAFGHAWLGTVDRVRVTWKWFITSALMPPAATVAVDWRDPRFAQSLVYSPIEFEIVSEGSTTPTRREVEARLSAPPTGWAAERSL